MIRGRNVCNLDNTKIIRSDATHNILIDNTEGGDAKTFACSE